MGKKNKSIVIIWVLAIIAVFVGIILTNTQQPKNETIKEMMRDAVMHEANHINFLGIKEINPGLFSAFIVTIVLLTASALIRIFFIPRFKINPGKFQLVLEELVAFFNNFAKTNSPHCNRFLSVYIFGAGMYIFWGTLFELFGFQAVTTQGHGVTLPAPLSDINGAIALGALSYSVILTGGLLKNGFKGLGGALKDFSMPISMSFRLFGAMLSGVLVTELVYYYKGLSFVLPILVGVLFTLLHAVIQTYVLITLTASTYGEVTEPRTHKH